ncbi:ABC transporter permease [uncultured Parabacteroides sp.]|uniref:ABC transporter permease n=1 Tax=uncultured Parabacteroides sp. TaxID=512312 RepID=UPI0026112935|nr:ABC transporter permease [uncultured Parabacteroides sp.]
MNNILNFKSFLKFLGRNKAYTLIDVFGLSVSLMFVLLIAVYTVQEMSTDKFHTKADRIYLVGNENWMATGAAIPYKIKERYPEVEKVCPVVASNFSGTVVVAGDRKFKANVMFADSTFFDFFDFRLSQGSREQALAAMNYAVVSTSFARKMFGTDDPMGRQLMIGDTISATVNGVVEDLLHSSIPEADVIVRWEQVGCLNWSLAPDQLGNAGSTSAFVLAREGSDFPSRAEDMANWFKEFYWPYQYGTAKEVRILPLSEQYFTKTSDSSLRNGDWRFVVVLMSVGFLILIFAVINYINLTVAQAGFRAKEMATRRLLGSSRGELFMRLILESTLLTFISLIVGVLLALAVVPFVNDLLQTRVDMSVLGRPVWLLALVSLTVVVGTLSGLLPAIIISSSKPIEVVRGTFRTKTKMVFSKFFIVFQNVITITMIAASIVMVGQIVHMINAPVGYKTKNLLAMGSVDERQLSAFVGELKGLSCVDRVGKTRGLPLFGSNNLTTTYQGQNMSFQQFVMDKECYDMLGLEILRDNHLTTGGWYLNEQAMRDMNLPEDAVSFTLDRSDKPVAIAGIIRDFYCHGNVTTVKSPVMFRFLKDNETPWMILIETQGDPFVAKETIGKVYEKVTGLEFEAYFMDESLQKSFDSQIRLAKIVIVFSIIAIVISLLGLLAMSTYFIQQRSQEVSVRKVFGSSNRQILVRLVFTFLNYVLIAFLIAIPIIIYFMRDWLSDYSYRISLSPLIFIAAGLFCLVISFVSVFFQSYRAATSNPVDSFRYRN